MRLVTTAAPLRRLAHSIARLAILMLISVLLAGLIALIWGPAWVAPPVDFPQGPGAAAAYVHLYRQVHGQAGRFWQGQAVEVTVSQEELSGVLSSMLLSGRRGGDPVRKVRAKLVDGEIGIESILQLRHPWLPSRLEGPVGLILRLRPEVQGDGLVRLEVTDARLGRIRLPPGLIWSGHRLVKRGRELLDPTRPGVLLPVGKLSADLMGRGLMIRSITVADGHLRLVLCLSP